MSKANEPAGRAADAQSFLHDAATVAQQISPKYGKEIKLADSLIPVAVHGGLALAHFLHHLFHRHEPKPAAKE